MYWLRLPIVRKSSLLLVLALSLSIIGSRIGSPPAAAQQAGVEVVNSAQLQLPPSAIPSGFTLTDSLSQSPSDADDDPLQSSLHSSYYEDLNMYGGWYEEANQPTSEGTLYLSYLGSYYPSQAIALDALDDASQDGSISCTVGIGCQQFSLDTTDEDGNDATAVVRLFVVANALFEGGYTVDQDDFSAYQEAGNAGIDSLSSAFVQVMSHLPPPPTPWSGTVPTATPTAIPTPTSTPTPPPAKPLVRKDFHMWVRIEGAAAEPDWVQITPPLRQVKVGSKVRFSIYLSVSKPHAAGTVTSVFVVKRAGKIVLQQELPEHMGSGPPNTYWYHALLRLQQPGIYAFSGAAVVNGKSRHATTSIDVLRRAPKKPPPVSFTFNKLKVLGSNNPPGLSFRPGQSIHVSVDWTVQNETGNTPVWIILTPQVPVKRSWRAFGNPTEHEFDTQNGDHFYEFWLVPPGSLTGKLKLVIGVTVGQQTAQKAAVINITS